MSAITDFYAGSGTDHRRRTLEHILSWDNARLESVHDYIQWLFPLPEPSAFNPDAPLLTPADIAAFLADDRLRENLHSSLRRMLDFYGFSGPQGVPEAAAWLTPGNHNFLRITRILRSVHLLGLGIEAGAFLVRLEALHASEAGTVIGARTMDFWRGALR